MNSSDEDLIAPGETLPMAQSPSQIGEENAEIDLQTSADPNHAHHQKTLGSIPDPVPQASATVTGLAATSHVNGVGMWRSWQRSFRRPLDALLDLMDNAVDANHGRGQVSLTKTSPHENEDDGDNGLLIVNSYSADAYKEMNKVLEVFSSQKEQKAIGENGVGIKQASASLSDFSVVATKKGTRFQVGFLCISLQKPEGINIPSYTIDSAEGSDWEQQLDHLAENDLEFCRCMEYMGGRVAKASDEQELENFSPSDQVAFRHSGQDRLLELFTYLSEDGKWRDHECVFALLLDQMRIHESAGSVLRELREALPRTYLHLDAHRFNLTVDNQQLQFQYWERRLVELTAFPICVSNSENICEVSKDAVAFPLNGNNLLVYCGFNPNRSEGEAAAANLYIYSRECGRLVRFVSDCRSELNLTSGGTSFCQGLTIIMDDYNSSLPLTPTKQDIAWSDGKHGEIHRSNVYAWLRAVAFTYWTYHCNRFDGQKGLLNEEVKSHADAARSLQAMPDSVTPLADFESFHAFEGLRWMRHGTGRITIKRKHELSVRPGPATLLPFSTREPPPPPQPRKSKTPAKKHQGPPAKLMRADDVVPHEITRSSAGAARKRSSGKYGSLSPRTVENQDGDDADFFGTSQDDLVDESQDSESTARRKRKSRSSPRDHRHTRESEQKKSRFDNADCVVCEDNGDVADLNLQLEETKRELQNLRDKLTSKEDMNTRLRTELEQLKNSFAKQLQGASQRVRQLEDENMTIREQLRLKNKELRAIDEPPAACNI